MKQFLLFAGEKYYPSGGWKDFVGSYETKEQALEAAANLMYNDWWHVINLETGGYAASGNRT